MAFEEFDGKLDEAVDGGFVEFTGELDTGADKNSGARADVEQEVVSDRANNWRNRSIFQNRPVAGAGRGTVDDPRRLDRAQESELVKEARGNLPTVGKDLKLSAPTKEYKSVLEGYNEPSPFDPVEAEKLSRRDYADQQQRDTNQMLEVGRKRLAKVEERKQVAQSDRSVGEFVVDTYSALGQGLVSMPKLAVDVVAPDSPLAARLREELKAVQSKESDIIKARTELMQMSIDQREGAAEKYSETVSQFLSNPSLGVQEFARQIPMMAAMIGGGAVGASIGKGVVAAAGRAAPTVALADAISGGALAAKGASIGMTAGGVGTASIMAGGDAAGSAYEHIMDTRRTPYSVLKTNPDFQLLIESGLKPDEARKEIATSRARMAAMMAAPLGVLGFAGAEAAIAKRVAGQAGGMSAGRAIGMGVKDNLGEQLEEGGTQMAGNAAIATVDPSQKLSEGVAQAAATAAVTSAPFAVATGISEMNAEASAATQLAPGRFEQPAGIIAPSGTVAPAMPTPQAPESVMTPAGPMPVPQVDEKTVTIAARDEAMAAIGTAPTVDDAIAAANATVQLTGRAVQLDNDRLLNEALTNAGIADALAPVAEQAAEPVAPTAQAVETPAVPSASTATPAPVVWTGRRGDGYATTEDATRALGERQRLRPAYEWTVKQNAEGRFVLNGEPKGQITPAAGVKPTGNTQGATVLQNAPQSLSSQLADAGYAQPKETVRDLRDQADKVQRLQAAIARSGDDASSIQLYTGPRGEGGVLPLYEPAGGGIDGATLGVGEGIGGDLSGDRVNQGVAIPARTAAELEEVGRVSALAFGWRPILVEGLGDRGVQYRGQTYIDVDVISRGDSVGNAPRALAIQTIGHETTHNLEKSADPQDKADYALLRKAILDNAHPAVVADRVRREDKGQTYGENEVVADVSGSFWLESKFWSRLYELDPSAMRRIAYRFMENATKLIKAVKGSRLDPARFVRNVDQVREVAAQVWASKAKRGDALFGEAATKDQAPSFKKADDSRPGISAEVAPDPRDAKAKDRWDALTPVDKLGITKEVMDALAAKVFDNMGLDGWSVEYTSGMFEGGINPSAILRAPGGTSTETLSEAMRVFGYLLDQKGMVAFDESNTTSESQAGFVKVVLPEGLSTDRIDAIRAEIAARVPQAEGDTVRDGAIVYGNFSAYNDNIETLTDEQFGDAIAAAVDGMPELLRVSQPERFHSEYVQAYWDEEYDSKGREKYLEGTRYASAEVQDEAGRDDVRGRSRGALSRPWLEGLARSTDAKIARLVGDRQPRRDYSAAAVQDDRPQQPAGRPGSAGGLAEQRGAPSPVARQGADAGRRDGAGGEVRGAVHYGKNGGLKVLSGAMSGSGIRGAEQDRLASAADPRIKKRVYFYLPVAGGIAKPEIGLGAHVYTADLNGLYDLSAQTMRLPADLNALESAILDAGYRGYINREQGTAVVLNDNVPVKYEGTSDKFTKVDRAPTVQKPKTVTRTEGDMLVRKPEASEVMEIIKARQAGLELAAPSFKMQYGEARVLESEAATADAVFEQQGAKFRFGEVSFSRADVTETPNFKRWFGDSKVVDAQGDPLVVYHATTSDIKKFSTKKSAGGFYFTPNAKEAYPSKRGAMTSERGLNVMPAYLSINNPLRTGDPSDWHQLDAGRRSGIEARGFDGVIVENDDGSVREYIAFRPEQIKSAIGNNGGFDPADPGISRSISEDFDNFDELGAFNIDDLDVTELSKDDWKASLQEELAQDFESRRNSPVSMAESAVPPAKAEIAKAGLHAEDAFDFSAAFVERDGKLSFFVPHYLDSVDFVDIEDKGELRGYELKVYGQGSRKYSSFITARSANPLELDQAKRYVERQVAGYHLQASGHDIANGYSKSAILKVASAWRSIAKTDGALKLPKTSKAEGFEKVARDMGAFKQYKVSTEMMDDDGNGRVTFTDRKTGIVYHADVTIWGDDIQCCTMGLNGGGGLGTEFYAVQAVVARNTGRRFVADYLLSGINSYRRTEQAFSYAIKTGDTGVILPGGSNRVYGYNETPETKEDHDRNTARLALAGLRNVEELFPGVSDLSYDPATDTFTDANGDNAEQTISDALDNSEARAFGLGRSAIARAVITKGILDGSVKAAELTEFTKPVAYSMADVGLDEPLGESWGDPDAGVEGLNPNLRSFMEGSKVVDDSGMPLVMYHGTGADIEQFQPSARFGDAYFFSADVSYANTMANSLQNWRTGNVMPVFLSIKNPRVISMEEYNEDQIFSAMSSDADGLIATGDNGKMEAVIAFRPEQIKSVFNSGTFDPADPRISYSKADVSPLGYYSALTRSIEAGKTSAAPAAGWKELIKGMVNKGQAKQDEVEWSGVTDWLDTQKGRVTREQVVDYLRGNGVKVEEVVLGNPNGFTQDMQERLDDLEYRIASLTDEEESERQRLISAENAASDDRGDTNQTKYGSYTLPGGENYREVLLTLPSEVSVAAKIAALKARQISEKMRSAESDEEYEALRKERVNLARKAKEDQGYKSSHWDQPNILAHIRVNDRTDADGRRVLFVEELQSDFQQDYRKSKEAIKKAVESDFQSIVDRMKKAGVLEVVCD